jgi:hypothetical protein
MTMYSQAWIESLEIEPSTIEINDTIKVITFIKTSAAGCGLISTEINTSGNEIEIMNCYWYGNSDTICPSIDTVLIESIEQGSYEIKFKIKATNQSPTEDCQSILILDSLQTSITVLGTNSINLFQDDITIRILENPVDDLLKLQIDSNKPREYSFVIHDLLGRQAFKNKSFSNANQSFIELNLMDLPNGLYYLSTKVKDEFYKVIKFIKKD